MRCVCFQGSVIFANNDFETTYSRGFFKKILNEGIDCAYTGVRLIPRSEVDELLGIFSKKSSVSIPYLKRYKNQLFGVEKRIFQILETESKKHPELNLQDLLRLKYVAAEKTLIRQQSAVLDKISLISRSMSKSDHQKVRKLINDNFDKIFEQNPLPEERFRRKEFIYSLAGLDLSDSIKHKKLLKEAEKLPQSSDSVPAFIVKYAQPYKVKYVDDEHIYKIPRTSDDLAFRLLKPSTATDEHIYPKELYRKEEIARQNGDVEAQKLSTMRVTILTTDYINAVKANMLFDDFVRQSKYDVPGNIQKHVNRLIEIDYKWINEGRIDDAKLLADYIVLLKQEFNLRSKIVDIDISEFEKEIPILKSMKQKYNVKESSKGIKKCGHAQNSHKEYYVDSNGQVM